MTNILLPTDFSDNSLNAIEYAFHFYRDEPCYFILLNVFEEPFGSAGMLYSLESKMKQFAKEDLKRFYSEKVSKLITSDNHKILKKVLPGPLVKSMKYLCEEEEIDTIVMGTQGASGIKSTFIGSVTSSVMEGVKSPIIAVPRDAVFNGLKSIGYASDFGPISDYNKLNPLKKIIDRFGANLMIVNTYDNKHMIKEAVEIEGTTELRKTFKGIKSTYHYIESDDPISGLEQFIKNNDIQMLALITREHNFFARVFNSSTAKKMSFQTKTPLLIFHN